MLEQHQNLEVSAEEFSIIEAALHTQSKILHVQANAGGIGAQDRLDQVKRVLARLAQQKPQTPVPASKSGGSFFCTNRIFG